MTFASPSAISSAACASSAASCETLPRLASALTPRVDVLLLLIGDFGARALGLGLGEIRRRLALRRFALLQLGALRLIVEFCQNCARLHEVALVRLDSDYLSGDLESDLGNDLRLDRADAEHADFDILFGRGDPYGNLASQNANSSRRSRAAERRQARWPI